MIDTDVCHCSCRRYQAATFKGITFDSGDEHHGVFWCGVGDATLFRCERGDVCMKGRLHDGPCELHPRIHTSRQDRWNRWARRAARSTVPSGERPAELRARRREVRSPQPWKWR
jgi:hypothetical protein